MISHTDGIGDLGPAILSFADAIKSHKTPAYKGQVLGEEMSKLKGVLEGLVEQTKSEYGEGWVPLVTSVNVGQTNRSETPFASIAPQTEGSKKIGPNSSYFYLAYLLKFAEDEPTTHADVNPNYDRELHSVYLCLIHGQAANVTKKGRASIQELVDEVFQEGVAVDGVRIDGYPAIEGTIEPGPPNVMLRHGGKDSNKNYADDVFAHISYVADELATLKDEELVNHLRDLLRLHQDLLRDVMGVMGQPKDEDVKPKPSNFDNEFAKLLLNRQNIILEGVPGTGKTFHLRGIRDLQLSDGSEESLDQEGEDAPSDSTGIAPWVALFEKKLIKTRGIKKPSIRRVSMVLHPSTTYEDFVEGLRPNLEGEAGDPPFTVRPGIVREILDKLDEDDQLVVVLLLDEINRANIPRLMGDLMGPLEPSKRDGCAEEMAVTFPYSHESKALSNRLFIIGTMNTTDHSVAPLDAALRRRFSFVRIEPLSEKAVIHELNLGDGLPTSIQKDVRVWGEMNELLRRWLGRDAMLGHSYLFDLVASLDGDGTDDELAEARRMVWRYQILPQLFETLAANSALDLLDSATEWLSRRGIEVEKKDDTSAPDAPEDEQNDGDESGGPEEVQANDEGEQEDEPVGEEALPPAKSGAGFESLDAHLKDLGLEISLEGHEIARVPVVLELHSEES